MGRAPCCSKVGLHKGAWSLREDKLLTDYIAAHGEGKWKSLPTNAGLLRCGKSCRLRWMNYLRPGIKRGNITPEEDQLIIQLHSLVGNRWSEIAQNLPGRTDNEIKNHFNTHLRKRLDDSSLAKSTQINMASEQTQCKLKKKKNKKESYNKVSSNDSTITELTHQLATASSASVDMNSENHGGHGGSSSNSFATEVSNFSWPMMDLDERSEGDEYNDFLMSGCDLSSIQSASTNNVSEELEKLYDEYLQLLK